MSASLSSLTIGTLTLTPEFDPDVDEYAVSTSNDTNKITAVPEDEDATVTIEVNGEEIENGSAATWEDGENTVEITVEDGDLTGTYTVTVTKS